MIRRAHPEQEIQRTVAFTIPGHPVGWARARSNGKVRFTAPKQSASLEQIGLLAKSAMRGCAVLTGPVAVAMRVTFAYPASWPKRRRETEWYHVKDDAQVSSLECHKTYGDASSVEVTVEALSNFITPREAKQGREA